MAVFEYFPVQIRKTTLGNMSEDEEILMCFVAGSSLSANREYVVITSRRVLAMDERTIGLLGKSYVNVKENVPIDQIISIDTSRTFMNKLLGQSSLGLQIDRYKYLINNASKKDIEAATELITELANLTVGKEAN